MSERLAKRRKVNQESGDYVNLDFILGAVAEVERVFIMAKYVMKENRRIMTPQLFEAIIFLKCNERFWDADLVSDIIHQALVDSSSARVKAHDHIEGRFNDLT